MRWHLTPEHKPARDAEDTRSAAHLRVRGRTIVGATKKSSVPAKSKSDDPRMCSVWRTVPPLSLSAPPPSLSEPFFAVLAQLLRSTSRDSRIHIHIAPRRGVRGAKSSGVFVRHRIVRLFATGSAPDSQPSPDSPSPAFTLTTSSVIATAISSTLLTPSSGVMCGKTGWVYSVLVQSGQTSFYVARGCFIRPHSCKSMQ